MFTVHSSPFIKMKTDIYNIKGEKKEKIELPKEIFEVEMNSDLVYQIVSSQTSNRRKKIAKTKDRSEVSGGGKKPWAQKGTGRARHGSSRSPIWVGGGVTFGPNLKKNFKRVVPKKMRRKALFMVLSAKAKENSVLVIENMNIEKPKTKPMFDLFTKICLKNGSALVVLPKNDANLIKSIRNIEKTKVMQAKDLNVLDVLNYKHLVMPEDSIKVIKEVFAKEE